MFLNSRLGKAAASFVIFGAAGLAAAFPPVTNQPNQSIYEIHADHDPDGIGKFYRGREIAQVMGHQGADWQERAERAAEEKPDLLLAALKIHQGDCVADIGAGSGYYTRRLSGLVGTNGLVYAEEIQPEMLALLNRQMAQLNLTNVKPILGTTTDPKLPANSLDLILMVDVYHEFDHPYEMISAMLPALKAHGRIVFAEFRGEDPNVPIKPLHKMTEPQVKKEMSSFAVKWIATIETLPWQHLIIFQK